MQDKRIMKTVKIISAAVAALGLFASCQQQVIEISGMEGLVPVCLKASFSIEATKVSYTETSEMNLQPVWNLNDKVIGFVENNKYEFSVSEIGADGSATLDGKAPANCNLHLIYLRGASKEAITNGSMAVSYVGQTGDKTMPAVMFADGEVVHGVGTFNFTNAGAVLGIDAVKGVPKDAVISKITVSGENLSGATIALDASNKLTLTAATKTNDAISTAEGFSRTVLDDNGSLSGESHNPVLIAVPAGAVISEVSLTVQNDGYILKPSVPITVEANQYSFINGQKFKTADYIVINGHKWQKENLAVTESGRKEFNGTGHIVGDFFQWGASYNGYGLTDPADQQPENLVLYSSFTHKLCGDASSGIKLKTDKKFEIQYAPFFSSSSSYGKYNSDDMISKLELSDDVANIVLGGNWRIPSQSDYESLFEATYCKFDDKGIYVFNPNPESDKGKYNDGIGTYDKNDALLFLPAAGRITSSIVNEEKLWTMESDVDANTRTNAYYLDNDLNNKTVRRYWGHTIRPVSD